MDDVEAFLAEVRPRMTEADTALHNGDAALRIALWSRQEPITLFGAGQTERGWYRVQAAFEGVAARFTDCSSCEIEVVAAGVSGDLAYTVAFEHVTASRRGAPPAAYTLRVTTVFRREAGEWRAVHRHGDERVPGSNA
ncbi:MAG TPA: nuclear transport factor 2 family protein [Mycobacteriales bacterium]|nr:nuclear transport factor 2 family protein [Mycobacteriales bacterium]